LVHSIGTLTYIAVLISAPGSAEAKKMTCVLLSSVIVSSFIDLVVCRSVHRIFTFVSLIAMRAPSLSKVCGFISTISHGRNGL